MQDTRVKIFEHWTEIEIQRPEKRNAIREQTAEELLGHLEAAEASPACRAILIYGAEGNFCSGIDTGEQQIDEDARFELWRHRKRSRKINQLFRTLPELTKPVIAAVEGVALGGGLELALLCDLVVAGYGARLGLPECKLGLMPGGGGTQTLARVLGKQLAKEMMWTSRQLEASEALSLRLVNRVAERGEALAEARELAKKVTAHAPLSVMFTKQAVERGMDAPLREGMNIEADAFFALAFSKDKEEGLQAFRERRPAQFRGR